MNVERLLALVVILMAAPFVIGGQKNKALALVGALAGGLACWWLFRSLAGL